MLYKSKLTGVVVLFTGLSEGVVVQRGEYGKPEGHYDKRWTPHTNRFVWELYEGDLVLNNSHHLAPAPGEIWVHKEKGTRYEITEVRNQDSQDPKRFPLMVGYKSMETGRAWARPADVFVRKCKREY